ncbi:F-box protein At3g07870-like isoform X2 [Actinidia eriantha]|uniref:F-box protein At3g07870-like isoform X2 n=1 Tax=Actinidia eriantha TaxID=165200 RepID=UPI00258FCB9E|nr:F-box protein At3g07870-like isoform X2 [Actinidia eriantha]
MPRPRIQMIEDSDESEQTHEAEQQEQEPGQDRGIISDYSIPIIPIHIVLEIFLRLPMKTLLNCRLVCKEWLSLISDPQFANLHLSRSQVISLLLKPISHDPNPGTLFLVDLSAGTKLVPKFKLPITGFDDSLITLNSCNGFLCLCECTTKNPIYICNPILGEYITLPECDSDTICSFRSCTFGFNPITNEYKVVRSFRRVFKNRETGKRVFGDTVEAEICTLGEGLWRQIERVPTSIKNLSFNAFLNGSIHWLSFGNGRPEYGSPFRDFIYCFDFGTERFQTVPGPSEFSSVQKILSNRMHVGVLRGCLSICDQFEGDHAAIWVMKDYGVKESWSRDFVILKRTVTSEPLIDYYEPIRILGNGKILILLNGEELLLYDPEMECYDDVRFCGITSKFHGISYVPSLVSLEDVATGENLKIFRA